jgi:peptidoglycan/LPS O-acetylase OafA/YrhL
MHALARDAAIAAYPVLRPLYAYGAVTLIVLATQAHEAGWTARFLSKSSYLIYLYHLPCSIVLRWLLDGQAAPVRIVGSVLGALVGMVALQLAAHWVLRERTKRYMGA